MKKFILRLVILLFLPYTAFIFSQDSFYSKIGRRKDNFYSQCMQDKYLLDNFFKNKRDGFFVDIGAHNGISYSNTKIFEELGWKGICIEPIPEVFEELKKNRTCKCIQGCISNKKRQSKFLRIEGEPEMLSGLMDDYHPKHLNRVKREVSKRSYGQAPKLIDVNCYLLNDILDKNGIYVVDYLSIDTEGNEYDILKSIDYKKFNIFIIGVENNFNDPRIKVFMLEKGYQFIKRLGADDIYMRKN